MPASAETTRERLSRTVSVRAVSWSILPVCIVVFVVAWLIGTGAALVVRVLAFQIPVGLAVGGALSAWRRMSPGTPERSLWGFLAAATAILFVSEAYYSSYQVLSDPQGPGSPSFFDALNLAAVVVFILLLVSMSGVRIADSRMRARSWLSMIAFAGLGYAAVYRFVAVPVSGMSGHSRLEASVWALYTLVGLMLLMGVYVSLIGHQTARWSSWERLMAVGITGYGLATFVWPLWHAGADQSGGLAGILLSCVYMVGYHLLFMGTVYRLTGEARAWTPVVPTTRPGFMSSLVGAGSAVTLAAMPALVWLLYRSPQGSFDQGVYFTVTVVLSAAIVARTALADWESRSLRHSEAIDSLTGALNRRSFVARLEEAVDSAKHADAAVSLAVFDVDDFARFNVLRGRETGDAALSSMVAALGGGDSEGRFVARLGGDEFAIILPTVEKEQAVRVARELADAAHEATMTFEGALTLSAGVATCPSDALSALDLVVRADEALYWAKYQGRGRVAPYDSDVMRALGVEERIRDMAEKSRLDIVRALAAATDARDSATSYHSRQVAVLASMVCERIGLEAERARNVQLAALLHDVGKVGVPDSVLKKHAWLSEGERALLREHAELGARILDATELGYMSPWVRAHHERWDGAGYPDGLSGEEIPLEARIIAVCNEYDLMVSGSPDKGPLSEAAALQEIDQGMGTAFDADLAEALIEAVGRSRSPGWTEVWQS